jgi:hypothetical protein
LFVSVIQMRWPSGDSAMLSGLPYGIDVTAQLLLLTSNR